MRERLFALLLAAVMVLSLGVTAFAEPEAPEQTGSAETEAPEDKPLTDVAVPPEITDDELDKTPENDAGSNDAVQAPVAAPAPENVTFQLEDETAGRGIFRKLYSMNGRDNFVDIGSGPIPAGAQVLIELYEGYSLTMSGGAYEGTAGEYTVTGNGEGCVVIRSYYILPTDSTLRVQVAASEDPNKPGIAAVTYAGETSVMSSNDTRITKAIQGKTFVVSVPADHCLEVSAGASVALYSAGDPSLWGITVNAGTAQVTVTVVKKTADDAVILKLVDHTTGDHRKDIRGDMTLQAGEMSRTALLFYPGYQLKTEPNIVEDDFYVCDDQTGEVFHDYVLYTDEPGQVTVTLEDVPDFDPNSVPKAVSVTCTPVEQFRRPPKYALPGGDMDVYVKSGYTLQIASGQTIGSLDEIEGYEGFIVHVDPDAKAVTVKDGAVTFAVSQFSTFAIMGSNDIADASVAGIPDQTYTGKAITPKVTVTIQGPEGAETLTEGTDYKVEYKNNVNTGTAAVVITGLGDFAGTTKEVPFRIVSPATPVPTASSGGSPKTGDETPLALYAGLLAMSLAGLALALILGRKKRTEK